ncbi:hypothetical protein ACFSQE_03590 [Vogesella fluminis]|uniref:hypothetical protein n=1 Tax=Vogesella fluminis TaxID=1069161 RepID=UPI0016718D2C|nr:hypothetical protein [Vogesella fluminis]
MNILKYGMCTGDHEVQAVQFDEAVLSASHHRFRQQKTRPCPRPWPERSAPAADGRFDNLLISKYLRQQG